MLLQEIDSYLLKYSKEEKKVEEVEVSSVKTKRATFLEDGEEESESEQVVGSKTKRIIRTSSKKTTLQGFNRIVPKKKSKEIVIKRSQIKEESEGHSESND
jgi:hypothetical protein